MKPRQLIRRWLRKELKALMHDLDREPTGFPGYLPYKPWQPSYALPGSMSEPVNRGRDGLPVPPVSLWCGYGRGDEEVYLASGERDVTTMKRLLLESGFQLTDASAILDFGCAGGRMIRQFKDLANNADIWGVDISAEHIAWCRSCLSPPFHFATTTTAPHLPFRDGQFDLVFAGSVFTHIGELADAWLLELRRVLAPSGRLYCTIHDEATIKLLSGPERDHWLAGMLHGSTIFQEYRDNPGMLSIGRDAEAQIFYSQDYFTRMLSSAFETLSITQEAYRFQTAFLAAPREYHLDLRLPPT